MQKWEYKTLIRSRTWDAPKPLQYYWGANWKVLHEDNKPLPESVTLMDRVKQLGEQGWELVAVIPFSSVLGGGYYEERTQGDLSLTRVKDYAGFTTEEKWVFKRHLE